MSVAPETTPGGDLLVLAIAAPTAVALVAFLAGPRRASVVLRLFAPFGLLLSLLIGAAVLRTDAAVLSIIGGWSPPLGIALRADGLSAAMLIVTAVVIAPVIFFASRDMVPVAGAAEDRGSFAFWILVPGVWAALNTIFLANDLFSLYVGIELLTFSAVPLVVVAGGRETSRAALRYLLFSLLGAALYLLGVGLIYGGYGTLDLDLLRGELHGSGLDALAIALMTVGMLAKTALVPFHLWLPAAHAGAPPAASAILSALVVKGSYFVVLRVWLDLGRGLSLGSAATALAVLGAIAILLGSEVALRQSRLKLLVAYSTVAQIGYLFLVFPLVTVAADTNDATLGAAALTGGMVQAISHATAKAAMFLAVGLIAAALGHDRMDGLRGLGRALPMTIAAFLIAGLSLMGLPPSGGFWAKWLLLSASVTTGQWWWAIVILAGGLLAGGYVFRVVAPALAAREEATHLRPIPRGVQAIPLGLAIVSLLLGLLAIAPPGLLLAGRIAPGGVGGAP